MKIVDRSIQARAARKPDLFLSHSSRDKDFVRTLAKDLCRCGVDAWLDEWELVAGDSLYDVIADAATKSRFLAVVVGGSFGDSPWANDELKIGLSREKSERRSIVLPIVVGRQKVPQFLQDRVYLDFRRDKYCALARLAALIHKVSKQSIEEAIAEIQPKSVSESVEALSFAGFEAPITLSKEDADLIVAAGGNKSGRDKLTFYPSELIDHPDLPLRLRKLMKELAQEEPIGA